MTVPRSKLFISGDRLDGLEDALRAAPDALSIDLEDGVAAAAKDAARQQVAALLAETRLAPQVWVRLNGLDSGLLVADVLALAGTHVDVVNLPKAESPGDIALLEQLLHHIEAVVPRAQPIRIVPTIETPRGLRHACDIARASARVLALQIGAGDLRNATGFDARGAGMHTLRTMFSLAAAEAGVAAIDSTPHELDHDLQAFEAQAREAFALGFRGKSCMQPAQVAAANRVFGTQARP